MPHQRILMRNGEHETLCHYPVIEALPVRERCQPAPEYQSNEKQDVKNGTPGVNRTPDTRFRKPVLYPLSYRGTASF